MSEVVVRLGHHSIAIELPDHLLRDGILTSLERNLPLPSVDERIVVSEASDRTFALEIGGRHREAGLKRGALYARLLDGLSARFVETAQVPVLEAAAVGWGDGAVLIAGPSACGKSSLAAWFIEKGFALIADKQVAIVDGVRELGGYQAPLTFPATGADHLTELADIASAPIVRTAERIYVGVKDSWHAPDGPHLCGMMIFPRHVPQAPGRVERLEAAEAALLLKQQLMPGSAPHSDVELWHVRMVQDTPAVALSYSHYEQIEGLLDRLVKLTIDERLSPRDFNRFISGIGHSPSALKQRRPIPERSTRQLSPFMTIGMATYDDYDGVYFSLQAIRFYHPEILAEVEFVIIDNHPDGPCGAALKDLEKHIANLRYIPAGDVTGTAVRERVFSEAQGEFVLCMDCHVLFAPGSLRKLVDHFRSAPASNDLIQGPLIYDNLTRISTHWEEGWRAGMFGQWANDPAGANPDNPPFAIPFQGLGVFACRRLAWPGFNPAFRGFGGEEGYIHEKFRQAGGQVLCLPALRWLHRFGRPMGASYPNRWEDRIRNYLIGFGEIGWETTEMQAHFREYLGHRKANRIFADMRSELEGTSKAKAPEVDASYDMSVARLRFVAEIAVPIMLANFAVGSATCMGRAGDIWAEEFSRHGIAAADASEHAARLACCLEITGISSALDAEKCVQRLTDMAATIVFAFARLQGNVRDINRLRASWTSLFARLGYRPVDILRPALANDPRIDSHYQQNLIVFSKSGVEKDRPAAGAAPVAAEPGVSVILPVYNGEAFLGQAIESILLQTHRNFELIVVNDGSSDLSGAIADSYARVDKRVRVIHQDNGGEAAAFNAGCAAARFALLARLDHDDVALPERLALQVAFMEKNEDIAALGGAMRCIDREGRPTGNVMSYPLTPEACHAALVNSTVGPIGNPSAMMRKAAVEQCGGLRGQFTASTDFDLWLRMDERFKLANLPDVLVDYRLHGGNATVRDRFAQALAAQIARQSALLRRRGSPDPVDSWGALSLDDLAKLAMPEEERSEAYRVLFDAALANFATTKDAKYLKMADNCLSLIRSEALISPVNL
jgi:hypothetical protein